MDLLTVAIVVPVVLLAVGAIVYAVTQIARSSELNETEKLVWVLAVIFFPIVTVLVWFVAGPHPFGLRITRDLR